MIERLYPPILILIFIIIVFLALIYIDKKLTERANKTIDDFKNNGCELEVTTCFFDHRNKVEKKVFVVDSFELCEQLFYKKWEVYEIDIWLCTKNKLVYRCCKMWNKEPYYDGRKIIIRRNKRNN